MTSAEAPAGVNAIRRRWPILVLVVVVTVGAAVGLSLSGEKQYDATAQLLVRDQAAIEALLAPGERSGDRGRDLNTAAELIKSGGTAHEVQRRLRFTGDLDKLLEKVSVDTRPNSDIVAVTVRDRRPQTAAMLANEFAASYVAFRIASSRERYERAARLAQAQLRALGRTARSTPEGRELESRRRELEIAGALQTGGAQVVRRASVPENAARPRPLLSGALGLALGLLLGVGAVLGFERFDRRLRNEAEIEGLFALPILAAIPRGARRSAAREDRGQREAYGLLAANLRYATINGANRGALMVTSASPAEGKTSVTLGTARAFARLGLQVIAIEADLRRPSFTQWADVASSPGLTAVIAGEAVLRESLVWIDADTLEVLAGEHPNGTAASLALLPCGELPAHPQRVLTGGALSGTLAVARAIADVVIVDTAPLGTVNDAGPLLELVDSVVVIARLNHTTKDAVRRALRVLRTSNVDLAGVVVTDAGGIHDYGYYYGRRPERPARRMQLTVSGPQPPPER